MPWFKVDDTLPMNAKVVAAGNAAMGLWVRAGAWCSQQLTDGMVPEHMATVLGSRAEIKRLVEVGLWTQTADGYAFHQWDERQPSSEQVEADRAAARERQRRARDKAKSHRDTSEPSRRESRRDSRSSNGASHGPPDPTRPVPTATDVAVAASATFDDFWAAYPRKVDKPKARTAWAAAIKRADPDLIVAAAAAYRDDPNRDDQFTKYPQGWLSGDRWEAGPLPTRQTKPNRDELGEDWAARGRRLQAALDNGHFPDLKVIEG